MSCYMNRFFDTFEHTINVDGICFGKRMPCLNHSRSRVNQCLEGKSIQAGSEHMIRGALPRPSSNEQLDVRI